MGARKNAAAKRKGRTKNVSVSLDAAVLKMLRARAESNHAGNLSAAIAEAAELLQRQTARDAVAKELMEGRPPLSDDDRAAIDAELDEGWKHARRYLKKKKTAA